MSDLNLGPAEQPSRAKYFVSAVIAISAIVAAVVWFNPHHTAEITVEKTDIFAPHTVTKSASFTTGGIHVIGESDTPEDDVYLVTTLSFKDTLRLPLDPMGASATMITANNESVEGSLIAPRDLPRLTGIFPTLGPLTQHPLSLDRFEPGETRHGSLVLLFPNITEKDWKAKKSATLTIRLSKQSPQIVPLP